MHSTIMDPTVGTYTGFIVEPIDVLTMDICIPMVDIITDHIPMDIHITLDDITHITDHITMEDFIFPTPEVGPGCLNRIIRVDKWSVCRG